MGFVVIFIITTSDNWLDCIFLQLPLGPCRNCFRLCWKLLRIQIRKSRFYPSSHLTCGVLWTKFCPCPSFGLCPPSGWCRVAEMFCLGFWSFVNGNSRFCGVWGGYLGTTGKVTAERVGPWHEPSPLYRPRLPGPGASWVLPCT